MWICTHIRFTGGLAYPFWGCHSPFFWIQLEMEISWTRSSKAAIGMSIGSLYFDTFKSLWKFFQSHHPKDEETMSVAPFRKPCHDLHPLVCCLVGCMLACLFAYLNLTMIYFFKFFFLCRPHNFHPCHCKIHNEKMFYSQFSYFIKHLSFWLSRPIKNNFFYLGKSSVVYYEKRMFV